MKKNNNLNKEIIHNFEYKVNFFISLTEKTVRYEIGNRLIDVHDDLLFTKSPIFNNSLSYPTINNQIQINFSPLKIIELLQCSFMYNNHNYMFILETHFTLDNKQLFKTIKVIVEDGLSITNIIQNKEFEDVLFIIRKRSDFPRDHHYNPKFFTKQWSINDIDGPDECKTLILKKFSIDIEEIKIHEKKKKNVNSIFSKDHLYSKFENNSLATLEKGFIQESETLLKKLMFKFKQINSKINFIEKSSSDYITILTLFMRIHFKTDKVAVDNFFHVLDSASNNYDTFEIFCKNYVCNTVEYMLSPIFTNGFHIAIFETNNPIGFFLNEQWKIFGSDPNSTNIDCLVIPFSPNKAIIFSHSEEYIHKFDNKFENFQKMYVINALHEIIDSDAPLSLIYKNDNSKSAELFIEKILNEAYPEYLDLPEDYKNIPIIEIWKNNEYDLQIVLNAISKSNKNLRY